LVGGIAAEERACRTDSSLPAAVTSDSNSDWATEIGPAEIGTSEFDPAEFDPARIGSEEIGVVISGSLSVRERNRIGERDPSDDVQALVDSLPG
jgi:hypothetical protein